MQADELRTLAAAAVADAADKHTEARDECRRLRVRVFGLRVRLTWLRVAWAVGGVAWWLLTAVPRLIRWIGRVASSPFRSRGVKPIGDDDDGDELPPHRRYR